MTANTLSAIIAVSFCSAVAIACATTGSIIPVLAMVVLEHCLPSNYEDGK